MCRGRLGGGQELYAVIVAATVSPFRPILMTTILGLMTTILGLMPLVYSLFFRVTVPAQA